MRVPHDGAQRASLRRSVRLTTFSLVTAFLVTIGAALSPAPVAADATMKVVIVVGPAGSSTGDYLSSARSYAAVARGYGARVIELYSPNATWPRVRDAAQGANLLIYLGHGNGHPSPYGAFSELRKDGMGLNTTAGNGHYNVTYWGEYYIRRDIELADNAVVILNRLCYASGNSEWGRADPSSSTARQRADNYGAGFLRAGARAVFAEAISSITPQIRNLFTTSRTMDQIFMGHPSASGARDFRFSSSRTPGSTVHLDPPRVGKYWRAVSGDLAFTAKEWRAGREELSRGLVGL